MTPRRRGKHPRREGGGGHRAVLGLGLPPRFGVRKRQGVDADIGQLGGAERLPERRLAADIARLADDDDDPAAVPRSGREHPDGAVERIGQAGLGAPGLDLPQGADEGFGVRGELLPQGDFGIEGKERAFALLAEDVAGEEDAAGANAVEQRRHPL